MGGSFTLNRAMHDVPQEVLETSGCEISMGNKSPVGLRRKNGAQAAQPSTAALGPSLAPLSSTTAADVAKHPPPPQLSPTKLSAKMAAGLMQDALRELPLRRQADDRQAEVGGAGKAKSGF
ncbi:hypothetical protein KC357_g7523 [Hortaea werneckii]|nr:hypothetical protein KC357_g7523 [Hortaea werneckii]